MYKVEYRAVKEERIRKKKEGREEQKTIMEGRERGKEGRGDGS